MILMNNRSEDSGAATWYQPLEGEVFSFANMRSSILGRWYDYFQFFLFFFFKKNH